MVARSWFALFPLLLSGACSSTSSPAATTSPSDAGADASSSDAGTVPEGETLPATEYCESIATFFCDFYMRCGRIVAADRTECRSIFTETCNARYEPRYVELESAKLLSLSRAGVDACAAHLDKVECTEQASDLDGPCGSMWRGSAPAGAPCAIDVESFVCGPGTTCIVGLDFCGTCETAAPRGGACEPGKIRCASDDACIDGTCIARALPGTACSETKPCTTGGTCTGGTCVTPSIVGEDASCDAKHRCAYRSYCDAGKCVRSSLLGESCTSDRACVSGRCQASRCVPLRSDGESCSAPGECSSAQCTSGKCTPLPSACLAR